MSRKTNSPQNESSKDNRSQPYEVFGKVILPNSTNDMRTPKMIKLLFRIPFFLVSLLIQGSCKQGLYKADFKNVGGFVIGKESCKSNEDDYWLIDLTYYPDTPRYGDTATVNGITYVNLIKTRELHPTLKQVGMKVTIDFKVITPDKVQTPGCTLCNPITYLLKELYIINQGEIR